MSRVGVRKSGIPPAETPGRIPSLDGTPARLGGSPARCSLCGASGHSASSHVGGKAIVDRAEPDTSDNATPSGPAIRMDQATQFGVNDSPYTTGNANYKSPGSEGGMS
jgi:hypothetical protein